METANISPECQVVISLFVSAPSLMLPVSRAHQQAVAIDFTSNISITAANSASNIIFPWPTALFSLPAISMRRRSGPGTPASKAFQKSNPERRKLENKQGLRRARCRFIPGKSAGGFSPPANRQALSHRVESTEHDKPDCLHLRWGSDLPGELTAKWVKH